MTFHRGPAAHLQLISNMEAALQLPEAREPLLPDPAPSSEDQDTSEAELDGNTAPVNTPDSSTVIAPPVPDDAIGNEQLSNPTMNENGNATAAPEALDQSSGDEADRNSTSGRMTTFSSTAGGVMAAAPKDPESSSPSFVVIAVAGGLVVASLAALLVALLTLWRWKRGASDRPKMERLPSKALKSDFSDDDSSSLMVIGGSAADFCDDMCTILVSEVEI